jgi:hypothetical protein
MDVKSAFLNGVIEEEVYVISHLGLRVLVSVCDGLMIRMVVLA